MTKPCNDRLNKMRNIFVTFSLMMSFGLTIWTGVSHADQEQLARKLINSQGCKACHSVEGSGSQLAGSLEVVSKGLSKDELRNALVNPAQTHGDGRIPDFRHLRPSELEALVAFLMKNAQP